RGAARGDRLDEELHRHTRADGCQAAGGAQPRLPRLLAGRHRNLVAVGDPWQSIFGWRGADGAFLERLHRGFPEARTLVLSENFRATGRLVALANAVGAPLGRRRLWTRNEAGAPARLHRATDEVAEAAYVAAEIA